MHQVKVMDLPYGKFRDKGQPIDNISNYDSTQEEIVYICDSEQMRYAKLLFATKQGTIKKVEGTEFQVTKRTITATKLQPEDEVVKIQVVTENQYYDKTKEVDVFVDSFGDSSIKMGVRCMVATENYWKAKWEIQEAIKYAFDAQGIEIPFDQMEVTLKNKDV